MRGHILPHNPTVQEDTLGDSVSESRAGPALGLSRVGPRPRPLGWLNDLPESCSWPCHRGDQDKAQVPLSLMTLGAELCTSGGWKE
jgi:hypothetical protein